MGNGVVPMIIGRSRFLLHASPSYKEKDRVIVELDGDEFYLGTVTKELPSGKLRIVLDDGEAFVFSRNDSDIIGHGIDKKYKRAILKKDLSKFLSKKSASQVSSYDRVRNGSPKDKLNWLASKWEEITTKYYGSKLGTVRSVRFRFIKDMGVKTKQRAHYFPAGNGFGFSPKLFNTDEDNVLRVLKHEIAHQAAWLLDEGTGHGPEWAKHMRLLGLKPEQYDTKKTEDYLDTAEKKDLQQKKAEKEALQEERTTKQREAAPLYNIMENTPAQWYDAKRSGWVKGLIVCVHDQQGKRVAFIERPDYRQWKVVPSEWLRKLPESESSRYTSTAFLEAAKQVKDHYRNRRADRAAKRAMRNYRGW